MIWCVPVAVYVHDLGLLIQKAFQFLIELSESTQSVTRMKNGDKKELPEFNDNADGEIR